MVKTVKTIIITVLVSVILVWVFNYYVVVKSYKAENKKLLNLLRKEEYLKLVLSNNKYSGYLIIKEHYEEKLVKYAERHPDNKFVLALAEKEAAEINYYNARGKK